MTNVQLTLRDRTDEKTNVTTRRIDLTLETSSEIAQSLDGIIKGVGRWLVKSRSGLIKERDDGPVKEFKERDYYRPTSLTQLLQYLGAKQSEVRTFESNGTTTVVLTGDKRGAYLMLEHLVMLLPVEKTPDEFYLRLLDIRKQRKIVDEKEYHNLRMKLEATRIVDTEAKYEEFFREFFGHFFRYSRSIGVEDKRLLKVIYSVRDYARRNHEDYKVRVLEKIADEFHLPYRP